MVRAKSGFCAVAIAVLLSACAAQEEVLEGERFDIRPDLEIARTDAGPVPFTAPAQTANADWTHRAGNVASYLPNPALAGDPALVWSAPIGQGNGRAHRITADPVVADGRVFAMDSRARVSAVTTAGAVLWSHDMTPPGEDPDDASGGGLAVSGGRVFATSGFGKLVALDAASGALLWEQKLGAAATTAPVVADGIVYLVSRDSRAWAVRADTGRLLWDVSGAPSPAAITGAAAPSVTGRFAIFPMPSGELIATLRQSGLRVWSAPVSGQRKGLVYTRFTDVTGDPVVVGDRIYTGNPTGRTIAIDAVTGDRIWTARDGALGPVQVASGSVFLISDQNELVRLSADTGQRIWGVNLPYFEARRERRRRAITAHFGPLLAGGRLYVASGDGILRVFDPETGVQTGALDLPAGVAAQPAVAGGTLYLVTTDGRLHAFR